MQRIALYRKYRPKKFGELLGQDHVTQTLKNAVKDGKTSHAYIFTGPRGTGKTSAARLLATAVNCAENINNDKKIGEPCGKCEYCLSVFQNKAIDIIEIDAASNRGIDEIRELKENVRFGPSRLKFKVFIIDEVHMLTKEAFNALLKTLEEPPAHANFILATTEIHKVPQTILSRCQRFDFKRIRLKDLLMQLEKIAKKEEINIKKEALCLIAESSEGGFRDAISYLDQLSSIKRDLITEDDVYDILGATDFRSLISFVQFLKDENAKEAILMVNNLAENGTEMTQFTKNLVEFLRKILLIKVMGEEKVELSAEHLVEIKDLSEEIEVKKITEYIEVILDNANQFKSAPLPQLPLEIAIMNLITVSEDKIKKYEEPIEKVIEKNVDSNIVKEKAKLEETKEEKPTELLAVKIATEESVTLDNDVEYLWDDFLLEMKGTNIKLHALLKSCEHSVKGDEIRFVFPFKFHKDKLEERGSKKVLEEVVRKVYNKPYMIKMDVKESKPMRTEKKEKQVLASALNIFGGEVIQ